MIKKILKIKNIGRYDTGSANDDLSFGKQTVVFGANKIGKTTLVSILRSLKESNTSYITSRKTFGASLIDAQECEIKFSDGNQAVFPSSWLNENIEIFDNDFIHRNIFVGDKIEQDHKTQLHRILIDESNLKLQEKIDSEEANYDKLIGDKEIARKEIGVAFDQFIKLANKDEIANVDTKIKDNQNKQRQYSNQAKLGQLKSSTKLCFNFDAFETNIKKNIDTSLEQKIKDHIETCWRSGHEDVDFLSSGTDKISDEKNLCPFCGQDLKGVSDLISNLKSFFSDAYKGTQSSIKESIAAFEMIDIEKEVAQFKAEGFEFATQVNQQILSTDLEVIGEKLDQKQKDLSVDIKLAEVPEYKQYKEIVDAMGIEIESLKIESIDINALLQEESCLKLNKERFSNDGKEKYEKYKESEKAVADKKNEIDTLYQDLKTKLNKLFGDYLGEINSTLEDSFANFKLSGLSSISDRKLKESFFCDYTFVFDHTHGVNILDADDRPQFKNTLSDSDKRIFAFAFFIAKLKRDNSLSDKIVVLDDPFTSLDEERRDSMITILSSLGCEQIIILSHSRSFVKRCLSKFNKNKYEDEEKAKALRLENNSDKTRITKLDVQTDNDFLEGVERHLKVLSEADISSITSDYDNIRKIIEYIVKAKYGHLLDDSIGEKKLPMKYFLNNSCQSPMKNNIQEDDYQENHHDADNLPTPEELISKRNVFINSILPKI